MREVSTSSATRGDRPSTRDRPSLLCIISARNKHPSATICQACSCLAHRRSAQSINLWGSGEATCSVASGLNPILMGFPPWCSRVSPLNTQPCSAHRTRHILFRTILWAGESYHLPERSCRLGPATPSLNCESRQPHTLAEATRKGTEASGSGQGVGWIGGVSGFYQLIFHSIAFGFDGVGLCVLAEEV